MIHLGSEKIEKAEQGVRPTFRQGADGLGCGRKVLGAAGRRNRPMNGSSDVFSSKKET